MHVLQVGLGFLGRAIVRELHVRRLGRVVAAVDQDPALEARSLATLLPELGEGPTVSASLGDVPSDLAFDCAIVTTSSWLESCAPTFRALLERGATVVSTCEELVFPYARHGALAAELDQLARARGGRLLGTGINPGFLMDALPAFASAVAHDLRRVRVERVQNAALRRRAFQQKVGVGLDPAQFAARARDPHFGHVGLPQSIDFLAQRLGLGIDRVEEEMEPVLAEREESSDLGPVAPGLVAGLRQRARGYRGAELLVQLDFVAAVGIADPYDAIFLEGEPELALRIPGGVHGDVATAAIVVNAIPALAAAPPGLHTMASIPLVSFRARGPGARA